MNTRKRDEVLTSVAVIVNVNDETVLRDNLYRSPAISEHKVPLYEFRGQTCAGSGYNMGIELTTEEILVFAHQDVYLPSTWFLNLSSAIEWLSNKDPTWAVLGLFGICDQNKHVGRVWSSGLKKEFGQFFKEPIKACTIDELLIVLRRASGIRFSDKLPSFHLYATDICLSARQKGLSVYIIHAPAVHNSRAIRSLGGGYFAAYRFIKKKWKERLPIQTLIVPVNRIDYALWGREARLIFRRLWKPKKDGERRLDPVMLSRSLGYESE